MSVIQHTNTREDGFEQLIERALVGTTIESRGVLDILKNGLEVDNLQASKRLRLFYPKPTAADSAESHTKYASNQFSITRQAIYSLINPGNEIDMWYS